MIIMVVIARLHKVGMTISAIFVYGIKNFNIKYNPSEITIAVDK